MHDGAYDGIDAAYRSPGRWLGEHGQVLSGPAEESYLVPPGPGVAPGALRTALWSEVAERVAAAGGGDPAHLTAASALLRELAGTERAAMRALAGVRA